MRKRDIVLLLIALTAAAVLTIGVMAGSAMETGSWGLSFRSEGAAPVAPASVDRSASWKRNRRLWSQPPAA